MERASGQNGVKCINLPDFACSSVGSKFSLDFCRIGMWKKSCNLLVGEKKFSKVWSADPGFAALEFPGECAGNTDSGTTFQTH